MEEKRVMHIISTLGFFGAEKVMLELARALSFSEYKPYIGIICRNLNQCLDIENEAQKYNLEYKIFLCKRRMDIKTITEINRYLKNNKVDIVHSHGYKSNIYCFLASLDIGVKKVVTCHNWLSGSLKMKLYEILDKVLLKYCDKVVAVSDTLKKEIIKSGILYKKIVVINNGIDIAKLKTDGREKRVKTSLSIKENDRIIGTVGRLVPEKGYTYLLKAFKNVSSKFPYSKLLFVGDGPLKDTLIAEAKSLGLKEKVLFLGIRNDIPDVLDCMEIFVMTSLNEGMPVALLEAMAAKKPVIATRVGAIPRIIDNERTGILIEPKDTDGISNAIIRLFYKQDFAHFLALQGFEKVKNEFSSQKMSEEYLKVYKEIMRVVNGKIVEK